MDQSLFFVVSAGIGLIIGSFLNVVVARTRSQQTWGGRSHCVHCKALIRWFDNIPLVSFIWLRGACRSCRRPISVQYPLVETATAAVFVTVAAVRLAEGVFPDVWLVLVRDWFVSAVLIVIFIYDFRWYEIPDRFSVPGIVGALAVNVALGVSWQSLAVGIAVGAGFFLLQYAISRGRWIGGGDIRLGALMGATLGWPLVAVALFVAYVGGSVIALGMVAVRKKSWQAAVPFGTFLAPAILVALLWGNELLAWYVHAVLSM